MKSTRHFGIYSLSILFLGLGVGWYSRGILPVAGEHSATSAVELKKSRYSERPMPYAQASPVDGKRRNRDTALKASKADDFDPGSDEAVRAGKQMGQMLAKQKRTRLEQRLEKLTNSIGLSDAQQASLRTWMDEQLHEMESANLIDPEQAYTAYASTSESAMEQVLIAQLDESQRGTFTAVKEREKGVKVDSMALKNLSEIQKLIDFEEGQRDQVYGILAESARNQMDRAEESNSMELAILADSGVETDPYGLGIYQAMGESFSLEEMARNPEIYQEAVREVAKRCIDEKIEQLRPVLNPRQLEQYRSELLNKGAGMFGESLTETAD